MTTEPIKVLQVVGAMNRAGTETMLMNLYRHIDTTKMNFDFISFHQGSADYDQEISKRGGRIIKLSKTASPMALYRVMKQYGPYDIVHAHTLFHCGLVMMSAKLAGVKIRIAHAHTTHDNSESIIRKVYHRMMRQLICRLATDLLACSEGAARYLFGNKSLQSDKYRYFPNVIDHQSFLPLHSCDYKSMQQTHHEPKALVVGHVGRFVPAKNHVFILEVMKELLRIEPQSKLILVGDGDLKLEIEALAKDKGLKTDIDFVGLQSRIQAMFEQMDVFIFPSIYEGLGLVLLEAQAAGLPCVVSEAIQTEADLDLGLMTTLSLEDSAKTWAQTIVDIAHLKETSRPRINQAFEEKQYSVRSGLAALKKIYQIRDGESDGEIINRIV